MQTTSKPVLVAPQRERAYADRGFTRIKEWHGMILMDRPATNVIDVTDRIASRQEQDEHGYASVDRDGAIKAIRAALKRRTGKTWSVTGGRGTGWGWITISAPPKRCTGGFVTIEGADETLPWSKRFDHIDTGERTGQMTPDDAKVLAEALGLEHVHQQGVMIPAGNDYRIEYIARAEGRNPSTYGTPYWD